MPLGTTLEKTACALRRLSRSRRHAMRLEPLRDVVADGDGFRSVGGHPQLRLRSDRGSEPCDWVSVSFDVETRGQWLSPRLFVDAGGGFADACSFPLSVRGGRRVESIVRLPDRVDGLRLDPFAAPGRFALRGVTVREIGRVQLVAALLRQLRSVPPRSDFLRLAARALSIVRRGGPRALAQRLLAREREASEYQDWIDAYDTLTDDDRVAIRRHLEALDQPLVSVVMTASDTSETSLRRSIDSVQAQLYPRWELCIADDASTAPHVRRVLDEYCAEDPRIRVAWRTGTGGVSAALNDALGLARGAFVALLDHDGELAEHALYMMAVELNAHPTAALLYSDEDRITGQRRRRAPDFKPDWNPDLIVAQNFVGHLCVCRRDRVEEIGGFREGYEGAEDWDLVIRLAERISPTDVRHVPYVLYRSRALPGSTTRAVGEQQVAAVERRALTEHLDRRGETAEVLPVAPHCWRIRRPLPDPTPLVSVIIPTRDRLPLLRRCITSLRQRTAYPALEIVIVDNQTAEPATLAYLAELAREPDVTLVRYPAPFNYAAINNLGARHARGDVLALLNNDVEAIAPGWLGEMVSHACRPGIGAVGAMLYYPNDTIQHAGVVLGLGTTGIAAHAHARRPRGYPGPANRVLLAQTVSAVTAACLVVQRQLFLAVGGFDEEHLAIAYNDIDLCLRLRQRGYRTLWTPYAELHHQESASRGGQEDTPARRERFQREVAFMRRRWQALLADDPAYNPNLSLNGESFRLAFPPRAPKPWLDAGELDEPARAQAGGAP